MSVLQQLPASSRARAGLLAVGALAWTAAYWVNGRVWDLLLVDLVGLDPDARWTASLRFFLYDTVKIALLLGVIVFGVTLLRSYMSVERTRALLGGRREGAGNVLAAGLGVVTPFCSCSAVPAFIGFVAAGVPLGVTMSFLIASPLVNEVAIGLLLGLFGWQVTVLYVAAGLSVAIVAGWVLGRLHLDRWVEPFVLETPVVDGPTGARPRFEDRVRAAADEARSVLRRIWPYLLIGIGIGALIHGWAPEDLFTHYAGEGAAFGVVVAVLLGVPLYSNAAGVLPLVGALYDKGLPMGTLLAFMMSVVALSLPELILLRRVLKPPLLAVFVGVVASAIVAVGYLFNAVLT
ncbi:permease [Nocardioides bruguierae]|uniref:permease n=1 Tax=Nocardioides bruguierae TaxID=2945102 RepID=UPI0020211CEC|nr:permease [Nocardioides bruguierae]MCL8024893.1 permease [Nocardioides bruguierae]